MKTFTLNATTLVRKEWGNTGLLKREEREKLEARSVPIIYMNPWLSRGSERDYRRSSVKGPILFDLSSLEL